MLASPDVSCGREANASLKQSMRWKSGMPELVALPQEDRYDDSINGLGGCVSRHSSGPRGTRFDILAVITVGTMINYPDRPVLAPRPGAAF
jgi:hypothetical protein